MNGYYRIRDIDDDYYKYYFTLLAGNHEIILSSEIYTTMAACENGIESVQANCTNRERYEILHTRDGEPFFVLIASNGQEIGRSDVYADEKSCENGIKSVMSNGETTKIKNEVDGQ